MRDWINYEGDTGYGDLTMRELETIFLENRDPIRKICRNLEPISLVFGCRVDLLHQLTLSPERERGNVEQDPGNEIAAA